MTGEQLANEKELQQPGEVTKPSPDASSKDKPAPLPDLPVEELSQDFSNLTPDELNKKAAEYFRGLSKMLKVDGVWDKKSVRYQLWEKVSEMVKAAYHEDEERIRAEIAGINESRGLVGSKAEIRAAQKLKDKEAEERGKAERAELKRVAQEKAQAARQAAKEAGGYVDLGGVQASGPIRQSRPKNVTPAYPTEPAPVSENLEEYEGDVTQLSPEATRELLVSEKKELETQLAKTLNSIFIGELQLRAWKKKTESAYNRFFGKKFEEQIDSVKFALDQLNAKVVEIGVKLTPIISQLNRQKAVNISGDISKQVGLYNDSLAKKYKSVVGLIDSGKFSEKELEKLSNNAPTQEELNLLDATLRLEEETPPEIPMEEESVQQPTPHVEHTAIIPMVGEPTREFRAVLEPAEEPVVVVEPKPNKDYLLQAIQQADAQVKPKAIQRKFTETAVLPKVGKETQVLPSINTETPAFDFDAYLNNMLGAGGIAKVKEHARDVKENLIPLEGSLQADKNELSQTSKFWHPVKHSNLVDRIKDTQEQIDMYKEVLVEQAGMVKEAVDQFVKNNRSTDSEIKQANDEFNQHLLEIKGKTGDSKSYMELSIAMLALFTVFSFALQADSRLHDPKPMKEPAKPAPVKMADKTDTRPGFISDTLYNAEHFFTTSSDQKIETPAPQTMPDEEESVVDNVVSKPAMSKEPIMTPTVKVSGGDRVLREVNTGREIHDEPIMPKPVKSKFKPKYTEKHPNIKPPHPERQATPDIRIAKVDTHHAPLTINQKIDRQMKTILAVDDRVNKLQAQVEEDEKIPLLSDASTEELTKRSNVIKQLRLAKEQKRFLEKDLERLIDQKSKMNRVNIEKHKKGKDKGKIKTVTVEKRTAQGIGSLPTDPEYTLKKMQEQNKGRVFARETTLEARQANLDFERLLNGSEGVTNMLSAYVGAKGSESGKYFLDQAKELLAKAEKDMRGTNIHPDLVKQLRELQAIAVGYNNNPDANKPAAWLKDRPVVERQTPVVETLNDNKVDFTKILSANLQDEIDRINNRSQGGAYNVQNAAAALNRVIATKIDADRVDEFLNRAGKSAQEALVESGLTETDTENAQDVLKMVQRVRQELKSKETPKQDATVKPAELPDAPTDTVVDTRTVSAQQSLPPREFGGPKSRKALFEDDINTGPRTRRP